MDRLQYMNIQTSPKKGKVTPKFISKIHTYAFMKENAKINPELAYTLPPTPL